MEISDEWKQSGSNVSEIALMSQSFNISHIETMQTMSLIWSHPIDSSSANSAAPNHFYPLQHN